jgi:hypothetical protein
VLDRLTEKDVANSTRQPCKKLVPIENIPPRRRQVIEAIVSCIDAGGQPRYRPLLDLLGVCFSTMHGHIEGLRLDGWLSYGQRISLSARARRHLRTAEAVGGKVVLRAYADVDTLGPREALRLARRLARAARQALQFVAKESRP